MLTQKTAIELDKVLRTAISEIRDAYNSANLPHLRMDIEVSGRVTGELSLSYKFSGSSYSSDDNTSSHNILVSLNEYLRRSGWSAKNSCALISYAGEDVTPKPENDLIPF